MPVLLDTMSLEVCKDNCLETDACTGINFVPNESDNCELYQCPASVPEPTRDYGGGWTAYSRIAGKYSK